MLFAVKVLAGIAYARVYKLPRYYEGSDTWRFFRLSLEETKTLLHEPVLFFKDVFVSGYNERGNLFSGQNTYWNDLKSNVIIKMLALFNCVTNSSYYTDIIIFNFLFLFGLVALFRLFSTIFPGRKFAIIVCLFLLPSALFWCSGIHKDGLILSAMGIIIYTFYNSLKEKFSLSRLLIILFCFLVLFSLRNFVLFALLPALLSWWICENFKVGKSKVFAIVYFAGLIFVFFINLIFPSINFLFFIANKQHEFLQLEGSSKVLIPQLQATFSSFISFTPYALDMAFLRPHPAELKSIFFLPAFFENIIFLILCVAGLIFSAKKIASNSLFLFLIFFAASILLMSGYTIPFTGAIVRYKSFVLPLIFTPLLCITLDKFIKRDIKV